MLSILIIISPRNFNETEFLTTRNVLFGAKVKTEIASVSKEECIGMKGLKIIPDKTVLDALKQDYDAIIFIGGSGSYNLAEYPEVIELIKKHANKNKILAAICLAPAILAKSGVLEGTIMTVYPSEWAITLLNQAKIHYLNKDVVEDGNIITAKGPESAEKFAKTILKKLKL